MAEPTPTDTTILSAIPSAVASAVASAAGTPQSLPPMDPDERAKSLHVSLADLTARANALYAQKKYEDAAEVFSQATEMQAEINGEMAPENADILFLYGRSLFKVGQSKSDVLGGKPTGEKKSNGAADKKSKGKKSQTEVESEKVPDAKKPLFQFTGDEEFEDSDEEEEAEGEEEEDDDDLAVAFEILDLARVLFEKSLEREEEDTSEGKGKEKVEEDSPAVKHIKERLADTHDLLAEISLENEKYPLAINDCRASLKYKEGLYSQESEVIAEAHFKLSLALEFASVTTNAEDEAGAGPKPVDEDLRKEAAEELEKAIASTKLKLDAKEVDLAMLHAPEDNDATRKQIAEVKELIVDMEQRLVELRKPPMDVNSVLASDDTMLGVLGTALGESTANKEARLEEAKKGAKDVSGLVRKKAKDDTKSETEQAKGTNGKRKAEDTAPGEEETKKTKVEEPTQS
ncbi:NASP-related protein sim3 [Daldinia childiae]|uniref:NASP-related protein sim3 n=1 Tax=Daldinia childiae TaxID=326645 RepID=UPI0014489D48|nr:NASP-related protein sim3 [Daldinia childiae]KAF3058360.1 NASP-related protein sim3 [Daldinia childiae]